jgi:hypothetical protein
MWHTDSRMGAFCSCQMIINRARDCVSALGPFLLAVQALDQLIDDMRCS